MTQEFGKLVVVDGFIGTRGGSLPRAEFVGVSRYGVPMFEDPWRAVTEAQYQFVRDRGAAFDNRRWTVDYRYNLFAPLHAGTVSDFEEAGELTDDGAGRIAAPHSSTVLAINMFDHWRDRDLRPLGGAMQVDIARVTGFERPHHFGFPRPAQPDIEFTGSAGRPVAVEVKLREPYGSVKNEFAARYFDTPDLWDGLPALHELAVGIRDRDVTFTTLHVAQLIKHAIGLTHSYGSEFVLGYLWHYMPSDIGDRHAEELRQFTATAGLDLDFVPWIVDDLLGEFDHDERDVAWLDHMTERYSVDAGGTMDSESSVEGR